MHQDGCWNSSLKVIQNIPWRVKLYFVRCVEINFMWELSAETTLKTSAHVTGRKHLNTWRQTMALNSETFSESSALCCFFVIFLKQWWMQTYFALRWTISVSDLYWRTAVNICPTKFDTKISTCVWISDQFGGLGSWILELFTLQMMLETA